MSIKERKERLQRGERECIEREREKKEKSREQRVEKKSWRIEKKGKEERKIQIKTEIKNSAFTIKHYNLHFIVSKYKNKSHQNMKIQKLLEEMNEEDNLKKKQNLTLL